MINTMQYIQIPEGVKELPAVPFTAKHNLHRHPLFEPDALRRLLTRLPRNCIEIRQAPTEQRHGSQYRRGLMMNEEPLRAYENLQDVPRWILIKRLGLYEPDFVFLLNEYMNNLKDAFPEMREGLSNIGCWMFIGSPNTSIHFHLDTDMSFLNQISGEKTLYVYPSDMLPEEDREKVAYSHQQDQVYQAEYEEKAFPAVHAHPGEALFLPLYAPHRVLNGNAVTVAFNIGFHTRSSRRRKNVHMVNFDLRSMGMNPLPFNHSPLIDRIKANSILFFRLKNKIFKTLRPKFEIRDDYKYIV
ncbi:MAG: hypothetical protein Q8Q33_01545 [Chlamydiota bacterium]|nr:hypothetical protein [Chlamydiota bacterium]